MSFEEDVYQQLYKVKYNIIGKKVLDVGTRDGLNCINLIKLGASKVIGIDIDNSKFFTDKKDNIKLLHISLEDYNLSDEDKFDIITIFLWNMPIPQYDNVVIKLKSLLKENGTIYVGIHDYLYKYGYMINETNCDSNGNIYKSKRAIPNTGSVLELFRKYYNNVKILDRSSPFQWILSIDNQ
jgi:predicted TPR repeat methyltransferase